MIPLIETPFTWLYFPTALALGALHALEPGHAKTLTAAYLIGIKGTKKDAVLLGLSVAFTHSIVVIGISIAALWLGREAFTKDVTHYLQLGSGLIVVALGLWMLIRRIRQKIRSKANALSPHHHHAEPVSLNGDFLTGIADIIQTPQGERFRVRGGAEAMGAKLKVFIMRGTDIEVLELKQTSIVKNEFLSDVAPEEPHEFAAELEVIHGQSREIISFAMHEPDGHDHHGSDEQDHALMSDDEHARAHAATIPDYVKRGERPTLFQILAFGAAGGMIPCPASITVMLLALSIGKFASGLLAVAGFSLGLAITLVGIGMIVVLGLTKLQGSGRFAWVSGNAPIISAAVVTLSGFAALLFAH